MPTISSGTAEASNNYNKVDNVPAAASASTSNYTSCAASDIPKDAATPPPFHPNTALGELLPNVHRQGVVVGGKNQPLSSQSVGVGGKATTLKATHLASIPTATEGGERPPTL